LGKSAEMWCLQLSIFIWRRRWLSNRQKFTAASNCWRIFPSSLKNMKLLHNFMKLSIKLWRTRYYLILVLNILLAPLIKSIKFWIRVQKKSIIWKILPMIFSTTLTLNFNTGKMGYIATLSWKWSIKSFKWLIQTLCFLMMKKL